MAKYFVAGMLLAMSGSPAWAQIPKLGGDTSAKASPEDYARAKAEINRGTYLRGLWRSVKIVRQASPVTGPARAQADQLIDRADALATAGNSADAYPLLLQGLSILTEIPWTPQREFAASLTVSSQTLIADQTSPLLVTLSQRFRAKSPSAGILRMRTSLLNAPARPMESMPGVGNMIDLPSKSVKDFWTNEIISKDLIFAPVTMEMDVSDVPEGRYLIKAEILDGTTSVAVITMPITLIHDLADRQARIEEKLARVQGHESAKASVRYPFNLVRAVNGWRRETVDNIDVVKTLHASEALADQLAAGTDPLYQAKGDHKRHYWLEEAGEILPYRIYVPASWDGKKALPLVINLHGGGGNEDDDFDDARNSGAISFAALAEKFNMIIVSPSGYRPNGGYGSVYGATPLGRPGVWPASPAKSVPELSEADVLHVMDLVTQEYGVDRTRTYLVGNSMGGGGTWHLGSKYAERFAAIAPCASSLDIRAIADFPFDRLKTVPTMVVVGEFDENVRKAVANYGVAELKKRGGIVKQTEVKGGIHATSWRQDLENIFTFFQRYKKAG